MAERSSTRFRENSNEEWLEKFTPEFPYQCSRVYLNNRDVFWHWHGAVELFYMESGALTYYTPQGRMFFPEGSGGLINSDVLHRTTPQSREQKTMQLLHLFDASLLADHPGGRIMRRYILPLISPSRPEVLALSPENPAHAETLAKLRASFTLSEDELGYELKLREALTGIWLDLFRLFPAEAERRDDGNGALKQMMTYVQEHYAEPLRIRDVAAAGFVSERECYRAFHDALHASPLEYVTDVRLRHACARLAKGSESVTGIALACGFGSASFFGKVFRARFGATPTEYRRSWQDSTI